MTFFQLTEELNSIYEEIDDLYDGKLQESELSEKQITKFLERIREDFGSVLDGMDDLIGC